MSYSAVDELLSQQAAHHVGAEINNVLDLPEGLFHRLQDENTHVNCKLYPVLRLQMFMGWRLDKATKSAQFSRKSKQQRVTGADHRLFALSFDPNLRPPTIYNQMLQQL